MTYIKYKRTFLSLLVVTISVVCLSAQARKPNIFILLADDLGYSDLSCYGSTNVLTPVLDSLAAKGMKFTHFYAGSCVCSPSRAAQMTGKNAMPSHKDPVNFIRNGIPVGNQKGFACQLVADETIDWLIENMDHAVGRILRELDKMNALENTLVIFSSDNGSKQAGSNGILRGMKSEVWEGGIRVPTIVTWKNHVPVQSICSDWSY